jgi:hypothetical protein
MFDFIIYVLWLFINFQKGIQKKTDGAAEEIAAHTAWCGRSGRPAVAEGAWGGMLTCRVGVKRCGCILRSRIFGGKGGGMRGKYEVQHIYKVDSLKLFILQLGVYIN